MFGQLISESRRHEHVEACLRNVGGRSLLMTPDTAAREAHIQEGTVKPIYTRDKHSCVAFVK